MRSLLRLISINTDNWISAFIFNYNLFLNFNKIQFPCAVVIFSIFPFWIRTHGPVYFCFCFCRFGSKFKSFFLSSFSGGLQAQPTHKVWTLLGCLEWNLYYLLLCWKRDVTLQFKIENESVLIINPLVTRRHICAAKKEKIPVQLFLFQYLSNLAALKACISAFRSKKQNYPSLNGLDSTIFYR